MFKAFAIILSLAAAVASADPWQPFAPVESQPAMPCREELPDVRTQMQNGSVTFQGQGLVEDAKLLEANCMQTAKTLREGCFRPLEETIAQIGFKIERSPWGEVAVTAPLNREAIGNARDVLDSQAEYCRADFDKYKTTCDILANGVIAVYEQYRKNLTFTGACPKSVARARAAYGHLRAAENEQRALQSQYLEELLKARAAQRLLSALQPIEKK